MSKKKRKEELPDTLLAILAITLIVLVFIAPLVLFILEKNDKDNLGSAVCEKEYNMSYRDFSFGVLYCEPKQPIKPPENYIKYDGVKVKLMEE